MVRSPPLPAPPALRCGARSCTTHRLAWCPSTFAAGCRQAEGQEDPLRARQRLTWPWPHWCAASSRAPAPPWPDPRASVCLAGAQRCLHPLRTQASTASTPAAVVTPVASTTTVSCGTNSERNALRTRCCVRQAGLRDFLALPVPRRGAQAPLPPSPLGSRS